MPLDPSHPAVLSIRPWPDPVIDAVGHELRSAYVERYWLPVLGPSCTLLLRQLAQRFEAEPDGFDLDVAGCARSLGLGAGLGRQAPLGRAITRCSQFGAVQRFGPAGVVVRRRLPTMARHQLVRLPEALQDEHARQLGLVGPVAAGGAGPVELRARSWAGPRRAAGAPVPSAGLPPAVGARAAGPVPGWVGDDAA